MLVRNIPSFCPSLLFWKVDVVMADTHQHGPRLDFLVVSKWLNKYCERSTGHGGDHQILSTGHTPHIQQSSRPSQLNLDEPPNVSLVTPSTLGSCFELTPLLWESRLHVWRLDTQQKQTQQGPHSSSARLMRSRSRWEVVAFVQTLRQMLGQAWLPGLESGRRPKRKGASKLLDRASKVLEALEKSNSF